MVQQGIFGLDALACPACRSPDLSETSASIDCTGCGRSFPILLGVIDFRDPDVDDTANFSLADDRVLAGLLAHVFSRVATFNALHVLFQDLRDKSKPGARPSSAEVDAMLANYPEQPLSHADRVHGHAILDKIDHYLEDAGRPRPPRGIALENGGGPGMYVDGFGSAFEQLIQLDFSLAFMILAAKMAEESGRRNVTLVCANVERLPIRDGRVHFIQSNNVIEHVTGKAAMFREARRVLADDGLFFVLSPNHFSLYFEPHFSLPGYGFIPEPIRRSYVARKFGWDTNDVSLVSLGKLRRLARAEFGDVRISFIPGRLRETVTGGRLRGLVVKSLNSKVVGRAANFLVNKALLPVMPYHAALCFKDRRPAG